MLCFGYKNHIEYLVSDNDKEVVGLLLDTW